jgi:hypothetical protein
MMDLRYPIGPFHLEDDHLTDEQRQRFIGRIAETPAKLRHAVKGLTNEQLDTPYRPGGGPFGKWCTMFRIVISTATSVSSWH